jgi:hypothetical protein
MSYCRVHLGRASMSIIRAASLSLSLLRPASAQRIDPAVPAAGEGHWVFRRQPTFASGETRRVAWRCRSLSAVAEAVVGEAQHSGSGGAEGSPRTQRAPKPDELVAALKARTGAHQDRHRAAATSSHNQHGRTLSLAPDKALAKIFANQLASVLMSNSRSTFARPAIAKRFRSSGS